MNLLVVDVFDQNPTKRRVDSVLDPLGRRRREADVPPQRVGRDSRFSGARGVAPYALT